MKKAKILYIITQSDWGGAQKYVFDLTIRFKDKYDIVVACGGRGELVEHLKNNGIKVRQVRYLVREICPLYDWKAFWMIRKIIREENPDIIHTNSSKAEILGNIAGCLAGVAVIFTAHGFVFNEPMNFLKRQIYVLLEKIANLRTKKIICVSHFDCDVAIKKNIVNFNKLTYIYNGIEFDESFNPQIQKDPDKFIIGTIANLYKNKGLGYLLEAAVKLNQKFEYLEFWIIGKGGERKNIEKKIQVLDLKNVKLLGFRKNTAELLGKMDAFTLPSLKEGFPYTILEAMSAGLPIVASRVGGIPEAIKEGENGFLIAPQDVDDLSDKLQILITKPSLRRMMGKKNRGKVRNNFSLEKMAEKTERVYNRILVSN